MRTLRQQYQDLNTSVNEMYSELVNKIKGVSYFDETDEDYEDLSDCENVSMINRNGDNIDVRVLEISKNSGIYVAKDEDESQRFWIGLNDLSSLYDKITIVELLEAELTTVEFYVATYEANESDEQNEVNSYTEVLAVFLDERLKTSSDIMFDCYAHLGQHSTCSQSFLRENCRKADEIEYKDLFNELENVVGYNLKIV